MWRAILNAVLIAATVFGPSLCCCSLVAELPAAGCRQAGQRSCCARKTADAAPTGDSRDHQCPCQKLPLAAISAHESPTAVSSLIRLEFAALQHLPMAVVPMTRIADRSATLSSADISLAGSDLLRALCVMRC